MLHPRSILWNALATTGMIALALGAGCNPNPNRNGLLPEVAPQVKTALADSRLRNIDVANDRGKHTLTLSGTVQTETQKQQAANIALANAPLYTLQNDIKVQPPSPESQPDLSSNNAIESSFSDALKTESNLSAQMISGSASSGILTLNGRVTTRAQLEEAEALAKKVPYVQKVVNNLKVSAATSKIGSSNPAVK